jgi:hypothetical protein
MLVIRALVVAAIVGSAMVNAATITAIKPQDGSVYGETRVTIEGTNFDVRGRSNDVFIGSGLEGAFCDPVPNECTDKRIVCLTAPFKGGPALPLSVRSFGFVAECQIPSGCTFEYTTEKTPIISGITPEWTTSPGLITFTGSRFSQGDVTVGNFDFTVHLGEEERCELINQVSSSAFQCQVHSMRPGALPIDVILGASGRAGWSTDVRTIMLYPTVTAVTPAVSSIAGGTAVTLTGTAFSNDLVENAVTMHGKPCVVKSVVQDQLVCVSGASDGVTSTNARTWQSGKAKLEIWYDVQGNYVADLVNKLVFNQPSETRWVNSFGLNGVQCVNCAVRITTHFVAPSTGPFNFTATGDDEYEFWASLNEEMVVRRQQTPPNSSQVLDITPFNDRRLSTGVYNTPRNGATQSLVAGQKYWIQGWLKQGTGGMTFDPQVSQYDTIIPLSGSNIAYSADWMPPVELTVRGTPAKFGDGCLTWGSCDINYAASATPIVTGVSGATTPGSTITIDGQGFSTSTAAPSTAATCAAPSTCGGGGCNCASAAACANNDDLCTWNGLTGKCDFTSPPTCGGWSQNRVTIGSSACQVISQTATQIQCKMGYTTGAGTFPVEVEVLGVGRAAGSPLVTVAATVRKIYPTSGSVNGANSLTILGNAFETLDGVTSVEVNGANCPITSLTSFAIECTIPAGSAASVNVVVKTQNRVAFSLPYAYTYETPMVRPGTTQTSLPISVQPRVASMGGGTILKLFVPSVDIKTTDQVVVMYGTHVCDITFALGSSVSCRTRGGNTPRTTTGNITVTRLDTTSTTVDLPAVMFVRSVTAVDRNSASRQGSTLSRVYMDGNPVRRADLSVSVFGQPCAELSYSGTTNYFDCLVGMPPTSVPTLPVLDTFAFTDPDPAVNPLHRMDYSVGVTANGDGSVTIPAGANWLMTKRMFNRPFVFKARVLTTQDSGKSVSMRVCVTENSMEDNGYRGVVADTADGLFAIRYPGGRSRTSSAQYAAGTAFANIGLDSSTYREYKMVVHRRYIRFYIDSVLIQTIDHSSEQVGAVGFGHNSQTIRVQTFTVEDLYPQSLQVNISGAPLYTQQDIIWSDGPAITSFSPAVISIGDQITIQGTDFGSSPYQVWAVPSATSLVSEAAGARQVCAGSLTRHPLTGKYYFTCTVASGIAGTMTLAFRSGSGKAAFTGTASFRPKVTAVAPTVSGTAGALLTITGSGFQQSTTVTVNGNPCAIQNSNDQRLYCFAQQAPARTTPSSLPRTASPPSCARRAS